MWITPYNTATRRPKWRSKRCLHLSNEKLVGLSIQGWSATFGRGPHPRIHWAPVPSTYSEKSWQFFSRGITKPGCPIAHIERLESNRNSRHYQKQRCFRPRWVSLASSRSLEWRSGVFLWTMIGMVWVLWSSQALSKGTRTVRMIYVSSHAASL